MADMYISTEHCAKRQQANPLRALSSHLRPKEAEFNLFPCSDLATQLPVHEPPQKAFGILVVVRIQNPAAFVLQSC